MIALNVMDPVAIQLGSIGYSCCPVLMILNTDERVVLCFGIFFQ
jgi:hypothetical protein